MKFVRTMSRDIWYAILELIFRICHMFVEWYYDWIDRV